MRDSDSLSNNIAQNRHSAAINDKQDIVPRTPESSKAKSGARILVVTVNNGENSTRAREFLPIYEMKLIIRSGILSFKSNTKPKNARQSPMHEIETLEMLSENITIKAKHNIDIGDFNFSLITTLAFLNKKPIIT